MKEASEFSTEKQWVHYRQCFESLSTIRTQDQPLRKLKLIIIEKIIFIYSTAAHHWNRNSKSWKKI